MLKHARRAAQILSLILAVSLVGLDAEAGKRSRTSGSKRSIKQSAKKRGVANRRVAKKSPRSAKSRRGQYARNRRRPRRQIAANYVSPSLSRIATDLTQAWIESRMGAATTAGSAVTSFEATNGSAGDPATAASIEITPRGNGTDPNHITPELGEDGSIPLNPLLLAYADSLSVRGLAFENQGLLVETLDGEILAEHNADRLFNPASVMKIATSLAALARLGPDYRFRTSVYTDGDLDPATGKLNGSLYLVGSGDPAFCYENALLVIDQLNRVGIRSISGNLVVQGRFYLNFSASGESSARSLRNLLNPDSWSAQVKAAYPRFLAMRRAQHATAYDNALMNGSMGDEGNGVVGAIRPRTAVVSAPAIGPGLPSLVVDGETIADPAINTSRLQLLAVHVSLPLVRVLKVLNDFSNNWMATVIGQLVGGPDSMAEFLQNSVGLKADEINVVTASGLGTNLISPRGTAQIVRKLVKYLERERLGIGDLLPIAGVDGGTLEGRFTDQFRASVVAKTGTLGSQGVSALAGVAYTKSKGPLLFVIYNRGRSVVAFRAAQDETVRKIITLYGGPAPVRYQSASHRIGNAGSSQQGTSNK